MLSMLLYSSRNRSAGPTTLVSIQLLPLWRTLHMHGRPDRGGIAMKQIKTNKIVTLESDALKVVIIISINFSNVEHLEHRI